MVETATRALAQRRLSWLSTGMVWRVPSEIVSTLWRTAVNGSTPTPGGTYAGSGWDHDASERAGDQSVLPELHADSGGDRGRGNNVISMNYGPLSTVNPAIEKGSAGDGVPLGNDAPTPTHGRNAIPVSFPYLATDFFCNPWPDNMGELTFDIGVRSRSQWRRQETQSQRHTHRATFGNQGDGFDECSQTPTLHNTGTVP